MSSPRKNQDTSSPGVRKFYGQMDEIEILMKKMDVLDAKKSVVDKRKEETDKRKDELDRMKEDLDQRKSALDRIKNDLDDMIDHKIDRALNDLESTFQRPNWILLWLKGFQREIHCRRKWISSFEMIFIELWTYNFITED